MARASFRSQSSRGLAVQGKQAAAVWEDFKLPVQAGVFLGGWGCLALSVRCGRGPACSWHACLRSCISTWRSRWLHQPPCLLSSMTEVAGWASCGGQGWWWGSSHHTASAADIKAQHFCSSHLGGSNREGTSSGGGGRDGIMGLVGRTVCSRVDVGMFCNRQGLQHVWLVALW